MKKTYSIVALLAAALTANAQSNNRSIAPPSNAHPYNHQPQVIHHAPSTQAQGDTVFVFDGGYTYDWNSTLPSTFAIATEDLDGATIASQLQPSFGAMGDFVFFYDVDPTSTLHYSHADTVFFAGATSWFNPAGPAENWLEMGPITVPAIGGTLKWRHNMPDGNFRDGYQVLVSTTGMTSGDFSNAPVFTVADNAASTAGDTINFPYNQFAQRMADVSAYAGQDIYIAFRHNANDQFILYLTDIILTEGPLGVSSNEAPEFNLAQNIPNPASGSTTFTYSLTKNSTVSFNVYDVTGNIVYSQNESNQAAGAHRFDMNTSDLSNGMYYYTITVNGQKQTRKMIVSNN